MEKIQTKKQSVRVRALVFFCIAIVCLAAFMTLLFTNLFPSFVSSPGIILIPLIMFSSFYFGIVDLKEKD